MNGLLHSWFNALTYVIGEEEAAAGGESEEFLLAAVEFLNLCIAMVAFYFAVRILPSISRDIRKRSWLFLSLAAITFGIAEIIGVLREIGNISVPGLYEITETIFVIMFTVGFYYLYTTEHKETLKLRRQSTTDDLTSLYTHGFFQTYLVNKVSSLRTDGNNLTVLFLDIDDFKQYNDQFGHQEGDYVLQKVAQTITQEARGEDIASRYGGEEFTLILGCDFETACRVAERLRSSVEERCSTFADASVKRSITVSVGLATFGVDADAGDKLVKIADARMYEAKRRGKNQVYTGDVDLGESDSPARERSTGHLGIAPG
ncbi:MAG: GGDEF domain-containing protein [Actinobacteria bacterium]|nr:GGDEF domain-containing protein [Actinomycetota bacterium]MCL5883383.1 GGDEF domain-containing protein [Actinomycetota bacterium]